MMELLETKQMLKKVRFGRMKWTKEKPTQGAEWYWYRDTEGKPAIGYLLGSCLSFPGGKYVYIDNAPGEFAGPIHKPEEE